jgi:hypothetical protein
MDSTEDNVSKVNELRFAIAQVLRFVGKDHPDNEFLNKVEANLVSCVEDLKDINNNRTSSLAIERGLRKSQIPNHRITEIIAELRKSMRS